MLGGPLAPTPVRLVLLLALFACSASAQPGEQIAVQPLVTLSRGVLSDAGGGALVAAQASAGARRGPVTGRLRGTAASTMSFGFATETRTRWEVAALGGVTLGDRARVFLGAGPGITGGRIDRACFLSSICPDESLPAVLALALGLDAAIRTTGIMRVGIQASATITRQRPVAGVGLLVGFGR